MNNADVLTTLLFGLLDRSQAIGEILRRAKREGREPSEEEVNSLVADDDNARSDLQAAIRARREMKF